MKVLFTRAWGFLIGALLLAACGGSGGPVGGETTPPPSSGPVPASLTFFSDLTSLRSSGADTANLTAIVKDASNVVIPGATVNFSADSGSLSVTQPTTDDSGQAKATLGTEGNPANRTITVTATVQGTTISQTITLAVTGTTLNISGPVSMASGDTQPITLNLRDADGNGIGNQTISLTSSLNNTFSNASPITGATGAATINYTASNGGSETINATALNGTIVAALSFPVSSETFTLTKTAPQGDIPLTTNASITLFYGNPNPVANQAVTVATTRGTINGSGTNSQQLITDANGEIQFTVQSNNAGPGVITSTTGNGLSAQLTVEFVATTAASIAVSASPTSIAPNGKESSISAVVRDANLNLVKGKTVSFSLDDISGGSLSQATAITDSNGLASTVYVSGNSPSALNGVRVTATVVDTPAVTGTATLTVAQSPLFITIGTGNSIEEPNDTIYAKNFAVSVTDAAGAGRPNQQLSISVTPVLPTEGNGLAYFKGYREWTGTVWGTVITASCQNEDLNLNGILDPTDNDLNNNGKLEPGNQVTLSNGTVTTDSTGFATVTLRYPQELAYYMQVMIRVTANVSGTESRAEQIWLLEGLSTDFNRENTAPPGPVSKFGISATCADAL